MYWGHTFFSESVVIDNNKIQTVLAWPTLMNLKPLRSILAKYGIMEDSLKATGYIVPRETILLRKDNLWH